MQNNRRERRSMFSLAGWLFADLLLALTTIFIVASAVGVYVPPQPKSKPTPTPRVLPRLELKFHRFTINVDPGGLLNGDQNAVDSVKQQVRAQSFLKGRSAGLVIVYGGAPSDSDISTALNIASKIYDIILALGKQGFAFSRASRYDPLYVFGNGLSIVTVDVFLFS